MDHGVPTQPQRRPAAQPGFAHHILKTCWRDCPRTNDYIERRRTEGKSDSEVRRCIKGYLARELSRANVPGSGVCGFVPLSDVGGDSAAG